ncbi:MAG: prepilin-type N-terminal cleavage/methylation domain-containing protein [Phycisphaerales bacterium]
MMRKARRREGAKARRLAASRRRAPGFTLVELMIAVSVLIVIIVATSKIFSTAGKVTSLGQATADVLQETTAIERQIRSDFERLAPNGVFAIRCVSIRNDINVPIGGPLLNPALPDAAMIRADQLLFFTNGVQSIQTYRQGSGSSHKGQGTAARIYYGHAFQLPEGKEIDVIDSQEVRAQDPLVLAVNPLVPWYSGSYGMIRTVFRSNVGGTPPDYSIQGQITPIDATQPVAPQWLLTRHAVLLVDDGGNEVVFLNSNRSAFTIADAVIRNSRVDAAATQLNDIRKAVVGDGTVPWIPDQRNFISSDLLFYPRAERVAPGMHRVDQALTNNVLAGACSSFIIEWTYEDGVGNVDEDNDGIPEFIGVQVNSALEQPWFGLDLDGSRGVLTFDNWYGPPGPINTIDPVNIEQYDPPGTPGGQAIQNAGGIVYEAFFGYNRSMPLDPNTGLPWFTPTTGVAYTPWPSAIRITMVLHDPATKLEVGREVQFVIHLPNRVQ